MSTAVEEQALPVLDAPTPRRVVRAGPLLKKYALALALAAAVVVVVVFSVLRLEIYPTAANP